MKLVRAIITSTWLKPCSPSLISAVGNLVSIAIATPMPEPKSAIKPAKKSGEFSSHWDVYPLVYHSLPSCTPAIIGASSNASVSPTTQNTPVFQFSTNVTCETPFSVAIMNSFAVHLNDPSCLGLPLSDNSSSLGGGGAAGHMSCPNLLLAYIRAQVVKMNDDVKPGIAHELATPSSINMSPIRCENAIQVNAVMAAPKTEIKKVALFALTKGPDQNAIPVSIEL